MNLENQDQVAARLGLNPNTLANWRVRGLGPRFCRVGRAIRYDPADVEAWIEHQKVQSTSEAA